MYVSSPAAAAWAIIEPAPPVMNQQQIRPLLRRHANRRLAQVHRRSDPGDLAPVRDLQPVQGLRGVRDLPHAQVVVQIGHEPGEVHQVKGGDSMETLFGQIIDSAARFPHGQRCNYRWQREIRNPHAGTAGVWISILGAQYDLGAPAFSAGSASRAPSPIRTTPLISPPSWTSSRFAAMSPCTTLVDWISTLSSDRIEPLTSPPMIASREITSPSTSPPFPTSTCRPARTVPTTVPSIFTTPSAVMSPTTRIPVPMMDSPVSVSGAPCPFSVKIAMSVLLFHDREGVERPALAADFEVEVRRRGPPRAAREGDHLPRLHRVAFAHEEAGRMSIHRLIPPAVPQEYEQPVRGIRARGLHEPAARRPHRRPEGRRDVDPGVRLGRIAGAHLAAGHEAREVEGPVRGRRGSRLVARRGGGRPGAHRAGAQQVRGRDDLLRRRLHPEQLAQLLVVRLRPVQRRGELLHAAVLFLEPGNFALEPRHARRGPGDRSREREEQNDQEPEDERPPLPRFEHPQRHTVGPRIDLTVGMDDDRAAAILFLLLHPSNGAPRINSKRRARSSFE